MTADSEGRTPLHWAVDRGHLNLTELLLNHGADVNAKVILSSFWDYCLTTRSDTWRSCSDHKLRTELEGLFGSCF